MNLIEAIERDFIAQSWNTKTARVIPNKWRLVIETQGQSLLCTEEEYTSAEAQDLVDLLQRVNAESRK